MITRDTIDLHDENGKTFGIKLKLKTKRNQKNYCKLTIWGFWIPLTFNNQYDSMIFAYDLIKRIQNSYITGENKIMVPFRFFAKLDLRTATLLAFSVNQIINMGPTYFIQETKTNWMTFVDSPDYIVPEIQPGIDFVFPR